MINNKAKAYTEILTILNYIPQEEYEKIPKEVIQFYQENCDKEYKFIFDISKPLEEQKMLRETNVIIVELFKNYFATQTQKEKLQKILILNEEQKQEELRKKYNPDEIFKNRKNNKNYNM